MFALTSSGVPSIGEIVQISAGTFASAPVVNVDLPLDGSRFPLGQTITFEARSNDVEDGDVSDLVEWLSDFDGFLGTGSPVFGTLSDVIHTITARVTDSSAASGSDSISVLRCLRGGDSCSSNADCCTNKCKRGTCKTARGRSRP